MYKYKKVLLLIFFLFVFSLAFVGGWIFQRQAESRYSRSGRSMEYQERCSVVEAGKTTIGCYVSIAIEENDASVCGYLGDARLPGWVSDCYTRLAVMQNNQEICDFMDDETSIQECYSKFY